MIFWSTSACRPNYHPLVGAGRAASERGWHPGMGKQEEAEIERNYTRILELWNPKYLTGTTDIHANGANAPTNQSADGTDDGSDRPTDKQPKSAKRPIATENDTKSVCGSSDEFTARAWIHGIQATVSADTVRCAVSGAISTVPICWVLLQLFRLNYWG